MAKPRVLGMGVQSHRPPADHVVGSPCRRFFLAGDSRWAKNSPTLFIINMAGLFTGRTLHAVPGGGRPGISERGIRRRTTASCIRPTGWRSIMARHRRNAVREDGTWTTAFTGSAVWRFARRTRDRDPQMPFPKRNGRAGGARYPSSVGGSPLRRRFCSGVFHFQNPFLGLAVA